MLCSSAVFCCIYLSSSLSMLSLFLTLSRNKVLIIVLPSILQWSWSCSSGVVFWLLCCETRSCHARRHNDLEGQVKCLCLLPVVLDWRIWSCLHHCHFGTSIFHPWWHETCRVIQQQFWMNECDIFACSKHTLSPPIYFQGIQTPQTLGSTPLLQLWSDFNLFIYLIHSWTQCK